MECGQVKATRLIEGTEEMFEKALSDISSSIENLRKSFAPVLSDEPPLPTSNTAEAKPQEISRFDKMVAHVTNRMHEQAQDIRGICQRTRV